MGGSDAKTTEGRSAGRRGAGPVIEGEAVRVEDDDGMAGPKSPSPWRP
jgi:hypothetical protein